MAIFGTMPVTTAPRPLYNPSGVSRLTISFPVVRNPLRFAYFPDMSDSFSSISSSARGASYPWCSSPS